MNNLNRLKNLEDVIQEFLIILNIFLLFMIGLAIFGIFNKVLVVLALIILLIIFAARIWYLRFFRIVKVSRWNFWILGLLVALTIFTGFFHHDVPDSRDNIGYLTAGIKLAEEGSLNFYDPFTRPFHPYREISLGKDIFTSQFLPGYNAFLGFWYLLGGLSVTFWGNTTLFLFFLICVYGVAYKLSGKRKIALISILLIATFYPFLWFPRRTNSENLLMVLLWLAIWLFLRGAETRDLKKLAWGFLPVASIILVRGEGIAYLASFALAFGIIVWQKKLITKEKLVNLWPFSFVLAVVFLLFKYSKVDQGVYLWDHALSFFYNISDFLEIWIPLKSLGLNDSTILYRILLFTVLFLLLAAFFLGLRYLIFKLKTRESSDTTRKWQVLFGILIVALALVNYLIIDHYHWQELGNWRVYRTQFVFIILGKYFLLPYALFFTLSLFNQKRLLRSSFYYTMLILAPTLIFFLDPFVGVDQPWFLRRFYPTIIPLILILGIIGLDRISLRKRGKAVIICLLIILNIWAAWPIFFLRDYNGSGKQIKALSLYFEPGSLILMKPGWHWQQWAYAMHYIDHRDVLPNFDGFSQEEVKNMIANHKNVYVISDSTDNIAGNNLILDSDLTFLFNTEINYPTIAETMQLTPHILVNESHVSMRKFLIEYHFVIPREKDIVTEKIYIYRYK